MDGQAMPNITMIMFPTENFRRTNGWFPLFVHEGSRKRSHWDEIQELVQQGQTVTIRLATTDEIKAVQPDIDRCMELAGSSIAEPKGA